MEWVAERCVRKQHKRKIRFQIAEMDARRCCDVKTCCNRCERGTAPTTDNQDTDPSAVLLWPRHRPLSSSAMRGQDKSLNSAMHAWPLHLVLF